MGSAVAGVVFGGIAYAVGARTALLPAGVGTDVRAGGTWALDRI